MRGLIRWFAGAACATALLFMITGEAQAETVATAATSATPAGPPPLDAYGDLPGVEHIALSPDGKSFAVLSQIKGERRVLVFNQATNKLIVNAPIGKIKVRSIAWAGNGLVLITSSATVSLGPGFAADKYELSGVLVLPLDGSKARYVFSNSRAIGETTRGHFGTRLINGRWVGYYGGIALTVSPSGAYVTSGNASLYAVDLVSNSPRLVARAAADGHSRDWLVDEAGKVAATLDIASENGRWTITNAVGKSIASGIDPTGDVSLMFFGRDGDTAVYAVEDDAKGVTRWMEVPLTGGVAPKEILADVHVDRAYTDEANGRLIGYLERGAPPVPHFFDAARQQAMVKVFRAFPKLNVELADWTPDFAKLLVHTSGSADSGTWYAVDVAGKRANAIGYDRLAIEPEQVGPISTFGYTASDGLAMDGILTLPPSVLLKGREARNLPVVLLPHGGPTAADEPEFDWWAQAFASRGYAVFQPNFRGSTNRDDAFRRAGNGQWGKRMQTDISDGLDALAKKGIVDPKRACIVGASYGGYAALAGVTLQHGIYRCAVADAPVVDLDMMYNSDLHDSGDNPMMSRALRETLGPHAGYAAVSPRRHAAEADAPILLIHGKDDTVVPFHQSEAMASALRAAHKPVEMVVMQQEDHWLSRPTTRKQMLQAAVAFVAKHNPPD